MVYGIIFSALSDANVIGRASDLQRKAIPNEFPWVPVYIKERK